MQIYKRYIAISLLMPVIVVTLTLTSIIWLSQSLRFIDLIVNKGISISTFLYLSMLIIPSLLTIIIPVALFVSVLFIYNKLMLESELLVFKSAGISRLGLAKPALLVAGGVTIINYLISLYILPISYREFKDTQDYIRNNSASILLQEGVFSTPVERLTVYIESRDRDGTLHGVLAHDARNADKPVTYIAQTGSIEQTPSGPRVSLINGNIQVGDKTTGNLTWIDFANYPLDLSVYIGAKKERAKVAEERYINELFNPIETDKKTRNIMISEGHHRLIWPLFSLTLTLVALAVLFSGQLNRRGQWKRILSATLIIILLVVADLGLKNIVATHPFMAIALYCNIIIPGAFSIYILKTNMNIRGLDTHKIRKYLKNLLPKKENA